MTTDTLTLTAFLLARIAEDEAAIADAYSYAMESEGVEVIDDPIPEHRRDLAECKFKRAIVEHEHVECSGHPGPYQPHDDYGPGYCWREDEGNATLLDLAAIYADHPAFNPDWA